MERKGDCTNHGWSFISKRWNRGQRIIFFVVVARRMAFLEKGATQPDEVSD